MSDEQIITLQKLINDYQDMRAAFSPRFGDGNCPTIEKAREILKQLTGARATQE